MSYYSITDTIHPCDDFDNHVNAKWKEAHPIPAEYSSWNNFTGLAEQNFDRLKEILVSTNCSRLSTLWNQGNDEDALNSTNLKYQTGVLASLTADYSIERLLEYSISNAIKLYSTIDSKNSARNVLYLAPGSLGLPDRDFYFAESTADKRLAYKKFISTMLVNAGLSGGDAQEIYDFETELASSMLTRTELRDPHLVYNPISYDALCSKYSVFDWDKIFDSLKLVKTDLIIMTQPKYFDKLSELMTSNLAPYKKFLVWHGILEMAQYCDDVSYEIYYAFYLNFLSGQAEKKPRWKRVIKVIDENIGELLGKEYVKRFFSEKSKKLALEMVAGIFGQLRKRIGGLDWMMDETKAKAFEKLDKFSVKIGYPDVWKDFSGLRLSSEKSYFENILECNRFEVMKNFSKCYLPVDKTEWLMNPHTVNAYYYPPMNEIVFPAGILQEPFFSEFYDPGQNFGSFGAIIGHEITHGFDDKGKLYDADGNLNTWWTATDSEIYESKSKVLQDQFSNYEVEGLKVNGELTLGENIADLGGLTISYYSLMEYISGSGDEQYTLEQKKKFFYQWAISWAGNYQPTELKNRIITDPHSPATLRINGILRNMKEFHECFDMKTTNKLFLEESLRAKIW
ncbi:MAG: peptidase M13 [Harvfovirus sp.]|uniref:Peptidase M13 n=1 Tax=Harvfovirus sp. TaxID=2487768 RepID=A0A3G5A3U3_9VIRU|nr:MAG: peptidase M13 [Harvfovirus sp.]